MKSKKWLLGGISLQLAVGFTVSYIVYTTGTLITDPEGLNKGAAIGGLVAVLIMIMFVGVLIHNTNKRVKAEQALKAQRRKERALNK